MWLECRQYSFARIATLVKLFKSEVRELFRPEYSILCHYLFFLLNNVQADLWPSKHYPFANLALWLYVYAPLI